MTVGTTATVSEHTCPTIIAPGIRHGIAHQGHGQAQESFPTDPSVDIDPDCIINNKHPIDIDKQNSVKTDKIATDKERERNHDAGDSVV